MPRGDKSKYTDKQERKADHIVESYEERGVPEKEAERRAWARDTNNSFAFWKGRCVCLPGGRQESILAAGAW